MQREISDKNTLGDTLNPINDARRSTAIDRTNWYTSNYNDAKEKVQKIRDLINMGKYDADLAKYIPGLMDLEIQGMLDDTDTREKVANPSYKDKEQNSIFKFYWVKTIMLILQISTFVFQLK